MGLTANRKEHKDMKPKETNMDDSLAVFGLMTLVFVVMIIIAGVMCERCFVKAKQTSKSRIGFISLGVFCILIILVCIVLIVMVYQEAFH